MLTNYTTDGFENIQYQGYHTLHAIENKLHKLFKLNGYSQIATPTFENYDMYAFEESIDSDNLFKLVNHQGRVMALKPDATLPAARMAALSHPNPDDIIKFSYSTHIFRNFASPEIVKKELTQMGIEYFGNPNPDCDRDVIALAINALQIFGIEDIHIDIGHVGFINYLFNEIDLSKAERTELFGYFETKNIGDIHNFLEHHTIAPVIRKIILEIPMLYGNPKDIINQMKTLCLNQDMERVVSELEAIYHHLDLLDLSKYLYFDIGFTNQMNYYSDIIFKGYVNNWGEPLLFGGRYNHLSSKFGIDRPACGFGMDLLSLMDYLEIQKCLPEEPENKVVIFYTKGDEKRSFETAMMFRSKDMIAETFEFDRSPEETVRHFKNKILFKNTTFYLMKNQNTYLWKENQFNPIEQIKEIEEIT